MFERKNWNRSATDKPIRKQSGCTSTNGNSESAGKRIESNHRSDIEVMTAQEVADLLRVSRWSVYEMVKRHDIPFFKIGRSVRFNRADIVEWMG